MLQTAAPDHVGDLYKDIRRSTQKPSRSFIPSCTDLLQDAHDVSGLDLCEVSAMSSDRNSYGGAHRLSDRLWLATCSRRERGAVRLWLAASAVLTLTFWTGVALDL